MDQTEKSQKVIEDWKTQTLFKPSWEAFVRVWPQMVVGMLVLVAISFIEKMVKIIFFSEDDPVFFVVALCFLFFKSVIHLGLFQIALKGVVQVETSMSDLYNRWKEAWKYLVATTVFGIIFAFIYFAVMFLLVFMFRNSNFLVVIFILLGPAFYLFVRFGLLGFFIVDQDMGPFAALKSSYVYTADCQVPVIISWALMLAVIFAGFLALGIGIFVAIPLAVVILAKTYRDVVINVQGIGTVR